GYERYSNQNRSERERGRGDIEQFASTACRRLRPLRENEEFPLAHQRAAFSRLSLAPRGAGDADLRHNGYDRRARAQDRRNHNSLDQRYRAQPTAQRQQQRRREPAGNDRRAVRRQPAANAVLTRYTRDLRPS